MAAVSEQRWEVGVIHGPWRMVSLSGMGCPQRGTILVPEGQHDPEAREALRELREAMLIAGYKSPRVRNALERAREILGIPERCKECGQEIRGAGE